MRQEYPWKQLSCLDQVGPGKPQPYAHLLGVSREYGNTLYRDYVGIIFPYSLLTPVNPQLLHLRGIEIMEMS